MQKDIFRIKNTLTPLFVLYGFIKFPFNNNKSNLGRIAQIVLIRLIIVNKCWICINFIQIKITLKMQTKQAFLLIILTLCLFQTQSAGVGDLGGLKGSVSTQKQSACNKTALIVQTNYHYTFYDKILSANGVYYTFIDYDQHISFINNFNDNPVNDYYPNLNPIGRDVFNNCTQYNLDTLLTATLQCFKQSWKSGGPSPRYMFSMNWYRSEIYAANF